MNSTQTPSKLTASSGLQGGPPSLLRALTEVSGRDPELQERCSTPKGLATLFALKTGTEGKTACAQVGGGGGLRKVCFEAGGPGTERVKPSSSRSTCFPNQPPAAAGPGDPRPSSISISVFTANLQWMDGGLVTDLTSLISRWRRWRRGRSQAQQREGKEAKGWPSHPGNRL